MNDSIEGKVSEYLLDLCDRLQEGSITVSKLPVNEIKDLLLKALESHKNKDDLEYLLVLVEQNMMLFEHAINDDNILLTVMSLQLMACQCLHSNSVDMIWQSIAEKRLMDYSEENNLAWVEYLSTYKERNEFIQRSYSDKYITKGKGSRFSGKGGVVYTAVTGGYDDIRNPEYIAPDLDYICFTDNPDFKSDVWQVRLIIDNDELDTVRLARKYKILAHELLEEYDYSIWVDGKLKLLKDPREFINEYAVSSGLLAFPHFERNCIYDEALACILVNKGNADEIKAQMKRYKDAGYPEQNGLIDSACLIRDHHDETLKKVMQSWWEEVLAGSYRDQLSFNYACYKHEYEYDLCNMYLYNNSYFSSYAHN